MSILGVVQYILSLGPTVMLPLSITIIGMCFGQGFKKAFKSGITIGIGFVGINLVLGLLINTLGPAAQAMVDRLGLSLTVIDGGWPSAAAATWGSPVAAMIIPLAIVVNLIMIVTKTTKTMNIDLWNFWHFGAAAATMFIVTNGNWGLAIAAAIFYEIVVLKVADWTAPMVQDFYGLEGIAFPTGSTASFAPIGILLAKGIGKIPIIKDLHADAESIQKRFGIFGEPMMMGVIIGCALGILAGYDIGKILQIGMSMGGVMVLLPRMVKIIMEGLIPVSESVRDFLQKRFAGRELHIGLDAALAVGHPALLSTALILVPITILLALIIPGNKVLPFGDLATIPFLLAFVVGATKGNIVHSVIAGTILMALSLLMATDFAPTYTTMLQQAQFAIPKGVAQMSNLDTGGNLFNWLILKLGQLIAHVM
ncbi:PTS galactitol transporter subunit IIC [Clostridium algoriphilum]|uniref:PTS galactitol transporter subunit IIC n=1 Tax=Clostridium algoriphilum TaxID=198347 RepID=UPI001CF379B4|nr:PTS galactitol transporter subunit IIC [Clostridium algoriphilum]MCB2295303.1 PTS galactitol transporter subunit IIC [Clostridium algoriphilum]